MIHFNIPLVTGREARAIRKAIASKKFSGDGFFNHQCEKLIESVTACKKAFLTPSCTAALEMAALLCNIKEGDEIIMPSYTFPSSANAFVLRGAKIVFTDIRPDTMNIDETLIEESITNKTKAIVAVHYGGVGCEMEKLKAISEKHHLFLIEDAAHACHAMYKDRFLGTIGDIGCISFHETKNIHCGEGGAILINRPELVQQAEVIREKGTDRSRYQRGEIEKYCWMELGSSFLLSEISAAFLYSQLQDAAKITVKRRSLWNLYFDGLQSLTISEKIELACIPQDCRHNGHLFFIKCKNINERNRLIKFLNMHQIFPASHYVPLHNSNAGIKFGHFHGKDKHTTMESERLLRLPLYFNLTEKDILKICRTIESFYSTAI